MMERPVEIVLSLALGTALGAVVGLVFFGGLAWTVRRLSDTQVPGRLVVASFLSRLAVAGFGVSLAARAGGLAALIGLLVGALGLRTLVVRTMAPDTSKGR